MRELFVRKVTNLTKEFLDNNQRTKLKVILMEICTNYQTLQKKLKAVQTEL